MAGFKIPTFDDRIAAARDAKQRALEKMRAKPAPDPAQLAARKAAAEAKAAAAEAQRAERRAALAAEKAAKAEARAAAQVAADAEAERLATLRRPPNVPTAAELKAARDARYAARKARQRG